jgi:glycosyl transferase family 25
VNPLMKVFVISLKNSLHRRDAVEKELKSQSIDFEFIDAVDGRAGLHPLLSRFNEKKFIAHRGRTAEPGELGCYASHMLAWEKVLDLNEPCVILEDDFILSKEFIRGIAICENWTDNRTFIRLESWTTKRFYNVESKEDFSLKRFLKVPQCLTGYIIAPDCAKAFLGASTDIFLPVDVFIRNTYLHKQAIYGLLPSIVNHGKDAKESTIGGRTNKIKTWDVKIKKIVNRIYSACYTALYNVIS